MGVEDWKKELLQAINVLEKSVTDQNIKIAVLSLQVKIMWGVLGSIGGFGLLFIIGKVFHVVFDK